MKNLICMLSVINYHHISMISLLDCLTHRLLETNPELYYQILVQLLENGVNNIANIINNTSVYRTWFSSHLICLGYLVGDKANNERQNTVGIQYYGCNTVISQELGINIFKKLIALGGDINIRNYYGDSLVSITSPDYNDASTLTQRINNSEFKTVVQTYCSDN